MVVGGSGIQSLVIQQGRSSYSRGCLDPIGTHNDSHEQVDHHVTVLLYSIDTEPRALFTLSKRSTTEHTPSSVVALN